MKTQGLRDSLYLDFVRQLPCCVCHPEIVHNPWVYVGNGVPKESDPDHLPHPYWKGIGIKVPDGFTVPLCRGRFTANHHPRRPKECPRPETMLFEGVNLWRVAAELQWQYHARNNAERYGEAECRAI